MQNNTPIAFYSGKMTAPERKYVNHEQELLAAIVALKVCSSKWQGQSSGCLFCHYLLGNHFTMVTGNLPNTYLDTPPTLSGRQACWSQYLQRFHCTWVHRPSTTDVATPLSCNPSFKLATAVLAVSTCSGTNPAESQAAFQAADFQTVTQLDVELRPIESQTQRDATTLHK